MPNLRRAIVLILFCLASAQTSFALPVPEKPDGYVTDPSAFLSQSARQQLESELADFEKKTSNQIVVAIYPSLEGGVLEDFSIKLAEKWKVGQAGKDNGVILIIFPKDRQLRIEVGYGLEGPLPDITAKQIIDEIITPEFKLGHMDEGVLKGVEAICRATVGEFKAEKPTTESLDPIIWIGLAAFAAFLGVFFPLRFLLVILFYAISMAVNYSAKEQIVLALQVFSIGFIPLFTYFAATRPFEVGSDHPARGSHGGWGSGSGGGFGGGFSGGGFSGGGGGFGGGGASGRW